MAVTGILDNHWQLVTVPFDLWAHGQRMPIQSQPDVTVQLNTRLACIHIACGIHPLTYGVQYSWLDVISFLCHFRISNLQSYNFQFSVFLKCTSFLCHDVQSSGLQLGGPALVPDMMYRILDIFNPSNARLLAATAAGAAPLLYSLMRLLVC